VTTQPLSAQSLPGPPAPSWPIDQVAEAGTWGPRFDIQCALRRTWDPCLSSSGPRGDRCNSRRASRRDRGVQVRTSQGAETMCNAEMRDLTRGPGPAPVRGSSAPTPCSASNCDPPRPPLILRGLSGPPSRGRQPPDCVRESVRPRGRLFLRRGGTPSPQRPWGGPLPSFRPETPPRYRKIQGLPHDRQ